MRSCVAGGTVPGANIVHVRKLVTWKHYVTEQPYPEHLYPSRGGVPRRPRPDVLCSGLGYVWFWSVWWVGVVVFCVSSRVLGLVSGL